jgi:phenylacetate-CoA ligase
MSLPLPLPTSRDEIAKLQSERKRIAFERAMQAPFHQKRLAGINPDRLDEPEEWAKIPLLDKEELRAITPQAFIDDFCIGRRSDVAEYWRSGGATGVPLFYPRSFEDMKYELLSFMRTFAAAGAGAGDSVHVSFPLGIHPVGQVYGRVAQDAGMSVNWAGSGGSTPSAMQVELIDRLRPTLWMGMSSYGIHLANMADERGVDLAQGSVKCIMCTAEPLSASKREKIGRMWGAEVHDSFGMTEAGMLGSESDARDGFHIWTDLYAIEVVDLDSGEPVAEGQEGGLVVTPLFTNNATPFIRWSSGDIVVYKEHGGTQGPLSVFPVIRHANRTVGFFKVRGININHQELEDFMFRFAQVGDFKGELVTRDALESLVISIELAGGTDGDQFAGELSLGIKNTFEVTPEIQILERGTLAKEFEANIKAPRFTDRRE